MDEAPVDTWEMSRNDIVEDVQGNRNVFIDYPELAWKLFDRTVPSDVKTLSPQKENVYKLVTSKSQITSGGIFVLVGVYGCHTNALSNKLSKDKMNGLPVTISNETIINPEASVIWTINKQSKKNRISIYNQLTKKYLVINYDSTNGFALQYSSNYFFDVRSASKKTPYAFYLTNTAKGKRNISILNNDFRAYSLKQCKPLYLYKLVQ